MRGACIFLVVAYLLGSALASDKLPKVLIIADGIHLATARSTASELKGRAEVTVPNKNLGDTGLVIAKLDALLGETKWDLIHFNFGFADLRHIDPKTKSTRMMSRHAGGKRVTSPGDYKANLRKIVNRLKATNAKLVWASSTPLVGTKYDHLYESGSEKEYNAIAAEIMKQEKIPINDMHGWVLANVKKFTDSFSFRRVPIHAPITAVLEQALDLPPKPNAKAKK